MHKFWYRHEVETVAAAHQLDPDLVMAVCLVESSGLTHAYRYEPGFWLRYMADKPEWKDANPHRTSASYGLMQVMYTTAQQHGFVGLPESLFQPMIGLEYGCRHLRYLLDKCNNDMEQALAQYNGGEKGNMERPFRNSNYVQKVVRWYASIKSKEVSLV